MEHFLEVVNGEDLVREGGEVEGIKAMVAAQIKHGDGSLAVVMTVTVVGDGGCCLQV